MPNIIVKNTTSYARTGIVTVGVPFSRAFDLRFGDNLVVNNAKTEFTNLKAQWYDMGPTWDSGGHKYARVTFEVDLEANEEKIVTLSKAPVNADIAELDYIPSPRLWTGLTGTIMQLSIEGKIYTIPISTMMQDGIIEGAGSKDFYRRFRHFSHLPDPETDERIKYIWVDFVIDIPARLNQATIYFRYGFYRFYESMDNASGIIPELNLSQDVTLSILGPRCSFRWEDAKIPSIQQVSPTSRNMTLVNASDPKVNKMPAGSSHAYKGVFCFTSTDSDNAELEEQILAIAEDWKKAESFPITGVMPPTPSYITSPSDALNRSNSIRLAIESPVRTKAHPSNWTSLGNKPDVTSAGEQGYRGYAHGLRGWPFLSTADYRWIPLLEYNTRQQALRHNWYYDEEGSPVTPNAFLSAGTTFYNGTFNSADCQFRGFNSFVRPSQCMLDYDSSTPIYGPNKENYTNKLCILQSFISPDWFSLEYARMYTQLIIYHNRPDSYLEYDSNIEEWSIPKAAGRVSECLAFLYELTGDETIKFWSEERLNYNLSLSKSALLNKSTLPGGPLTRTRTSYEFTASAGLDGLGDYDYWRPWEDAQFAFGFYLLGKAFLNKSPTDSHGLQCINLARDVAASALISGYLDGRASADRKFIGITFEKVSDAANFLSGIGSVLNVVTASNLTGSKGKVYFYHYDTTLPTYDRSVILCLKETEGNFLAGETINLDTGKTAIITRVYNIYGINTSRAITSPTNGYGGLLTDSELDTVLPAPVVGFNSAQYPVGYFKYARWSRQNLNSLLCAAVIARLAAREEYYSEGNSEIIDKADSLLNYFGALSVDNGDFEEEFWSFAGYIEQDPLNSSSKVVSPIPLASSSVLPSPSTNVENNGVSIILGTAVSSNLITLGLSVPLVRGTVGTQDVTINARHAGAEVLVSSPTVLASSLPTIGVTPTISITPSDIGSTHVTSVFGGRRKYTYIFIGAPLYTPDSSNNSELAL